MGNTLAIKRLYKETASGNVYNRAECVGLPLNKYRLNCPFVTDLSWHE